MVTMWARIENGTVAEITDIDPAGRFHPSIEWVESLADVEIGWSYDGESFSPPAPPAPPEPEYKTRFTPLEYIDRFNDDEQLAVVGATMTDPAVKLWYDRMLAASFVDLEDPRTAAGIDALIAAGLIDEGRREPLMAPELIDT